MSQAKLTGLPLYGLMLGMLLTGACNTIFLKLQDTAKTTIDGHVDINYTHPFLQCTVMFLGEFTCFIAYLLKTWYLNRTAKKTSNEAIQLMSPGAQMAEQVNLKTKINPLWLAIPASCDVLGSTLSFFALTMCAASVYQMIRGIIVIVVAGMARIFLKKPQYKHHIVSLIVIFIGVFLVGLSSLLFKDQNQSEEETSPMGIIMLLMSQLFAGCQFISEEKILGDYYLDPLKVVGLEGFWGLCYYAVLLPLFQFIPCDGGKLCPNQTVFEDTSQAFRQWMQNGFIFGMNFGIIASIASFNALGVAVTKNASAAQRSTIDTSRTVLIWVFFLIYPGEGHEVFQVLQLIGFIILVAGTLVYNEIIIVRFFGFDTNTKSERAKRELAEGGLKKSHGHYQPETEYLAASPTANKFDAQRQKRNLAQKQDLMMSQESSDYQLTNDRVNN